MWFRNAKDIAAILYAFKSLCKVRRREREKKRVRIRVSTRERGNRASASPYGIDVHSISRERFSKLHSARLIRLKSRAKLKARDVNIRSA